MITLPMDLEQPEVLGQVDHHEDRQGVVGDQPRQLRLGKQEANWDSEKKPTRIKSSSGDCDRSLVVFLKMRDDPNLNNLKSMSSIANQHSRDSNLCLTPNLSPKQPGHKIWSISNSFYRCVQCSISSDQDCQKKFYTSAFKSAYYFEELYGLIPKRRNLIRWRTAGWCKWILWRDNEQKSKKVARLDPFKVIPMPGESFYLKEWALSDQCLSSSVLTH